MTDKSERKMHEAKTTAQDVKDVRSKSLTWGELRAGDCHLVNGVLTFYSNGTGSWFCTTWTDHTHSGDTWQSSFQILTSGGAGLFNLGAFKSPRMDDGNPPPRYNWGNPFSFNPAQFDAIGGANQSFSC